MRSRLPNALLLLALAGTLGAERPARAAQEPANLTGRFSVERGVKVLRLWGTPKERGFAHGWLLGEEILKDFDTGLAWFMQGRAERYDVLLAGLPLGFSFSAAEEEELGGILDGIRARLPAEERKLKTFGREMTLLDLKALNVLGDVYALGCSSAALWGPKTADGTAAVLRNFEFPVLEILVKEQHVRIVAPLPGDPQSKGWVGVCHPGGIGTMTALGEDGIFVSIHDVFVVPGPKDYLQGNVPRLVAVKRIAAEVPAAGGVEKALERCRAWNTLFGNNFMVATADPAGGSPAGVIEYDTREARDKGATLRGAEPGEDGTPRPYVVCSNHHRLRSKGSCDRYDTLMRGCGEKTQKPIDASALFRLGEKVSMSGPIATLHQTVAFTGTRRLWVRLVAPGKKIQEIEPVEFNVAECVAQVRAAGGTTASSVGSR